MFVQVVSSQSVKDNSALTDTNMQASLPWDTLYECSFKRDFTLSLVGLEFLLQPPCNYLTSQPTQPLYGLRARHTTKEITLLRRIYSNDSGISLHQSYKIKLPTGAIMGFKILEIFSLEN